jgi:toxin ParE1/3/4
MAKYRISHSAKEDLIRIYHYGVRNFGLTQADRYFNTFFEYFEIIAERPYAFESVRFISPGYRRCVCGADSIFYQVQDDIVEIMAIIGVYSGVSDPLIPDV